MKITQRQQQIINAIAAGQLKNGFPPTIREICAALGLASPGSLMKHIQTLEKEGYLTRIPGKKRAWKLTGATGTPNIPLIGRIAAGTPILAQENREDEIPVDPKLFGTGEAFALRVSGDSMIEKQIRHGDYAIIKPQNDAENGEIVAVQIENFEAEATLKIFRKQRDTIELHPANASYDVQVFHGEDRSKIKIVGKLIGIIRAG